MAALGVELQIATPLQQFHLGESRTQPIVVLTESAGAQNYRTVGWKGCWMFLHKFPLNAELLAMNERVSCGFFIQVMNTSEDGNITASLISFYGIILLFLRGKISLVPVSTC